MQVQGDSGRCPSGVQAPPPDSIQVQEGSGSHPSGAKALPPDSKQQLQGGSVSRLSVDQALPPDSMQWNGTSYARVRRGPLAWSALPSPD